MLARKTLSLLLALVMLLSTCVFAVGAVEAPAQQPEAEARVLEAAQPLFDALEEFYVLKDASVEFFPEETVQPDGSTDVRCTLNVQTRLRVCSAAELPYVRGLLDGVAMTFEECLATALDASVEVLSALMRRDVHVERQEVAAVLAADFIAAVEAEVGEVNVSSYSILATFAPDGSVRAIQGCMDEQGGSGLLTFPLTEYFPDSADAMYANGAAQGQDLTGG